MNAGRHAASDGSFARSAGGAMTRGIVLVVIAVLIGIVLIRTAVPDSNNVAAGTVGPTETTAVTPTTAAPGETPDTSEPITDTTEGGVVETTTPEVTDTTAATGEVTTSTTADSGSLVFEARANNLVSVQVANTTTLGGAAGRQTAVFTEQGYIIKKATNWTNGVLSRTKVHYIPGFLPEARAIATLLGLDPNDDLFDMPTSPEANIGEFQDPDVLILLGSDLATGS